MSLSNLVVRFAKKNRTSDILCDAKDCRCVIGYERNGKPHWFDGVHQVGYNSYCSERHLRSEWKWNKGDNKFVKWAGQSK